MKILGLNTGEINSSAALLNKGEIISAVQEERLNRIKQNEERKKSQQLN